MAMAHADMETITPALYTQQQTSVVLGVSVRTIERLVRDGELRSVKVRDRRMIFRDSVDEFLEKAS
jgi:excisionase family DNA binding protein